jgi:hypothetical protein
MPPRTLPPHARAGLREELRASGRRLALLQGRCGELEGELAAARSQLGAEAERAAELQAALEAAQEGAAAARQEHERVVSALEAQVGGLEQESARATEQQAELQREAQEMSGRALRATAELQQSSQGGGREDWGVGGGEARPMLDVQGGLSWREGGFSLPSSSASPQVQPPLK